jgi:hypothetical protein
LPESVTDRVRRSHEDWVHLTKAPRYYAAVDEIREAYSDAADFRAGTSNGRKAGMVVQVGDDRTQRNDGILGQRSPRSPLGKLPGSVWTVPTQPLTVPPELGVDHFAAFPMEWPRRLILGWSPPGICVECGEGRRPVAERASRERHNGGRYEYERYSPDNNHGAGATTLGLIPDYRITGYVCACPESTAPTRPAVVLDPFGGTGTTALVADVLGRRGISVDMSRDYLRLARWRTTDPGERARAMQVEKPPAQPVGHEDGHDLLALLAD